MLMQSVSPITVYDREKLDKDKYLPDIRYMMDESKLKRHDWREDTDDEGS